MTLRFLPACALGLLVVACGSADPAMAVDPSAVDAPEAAAPPVLQSSYFSKDPTGSLTEEQLQAVLGTAIDLQFPARVGVVPLAKPFEPGEDVSLGTRSVAARDLAQALIGSPHFTHVSDISTEVPHVGGIEGLRALAARYRLRYLLLYSERFEDDTHLNGWAWLYPTIIGMFIAPGVTVESHGVAQADLLDVRTGTVLFTVVEPIHVSEQEWMVGAGRAHRNAQGDAAATAATHLAKKVIKQSNALVAFAEAGDGRKTRIIPAPIETAREEPKPQPAQVAAEPPPTP
jgi:hypothetical protein